MELNLIEQNVNVRSSIKTLVVSLMNSQSTNDFFYVIFSFLLIDYINDLLWISLGFACSLMHICTQRRGLETFLDPFLIFAAWITLDELSNSGSR